MAKNDEIKGILYVLVNTRDHNVTTYGMAFQEFVKSLQRPPANVLLLKHKCEDYEFHLHTQLDYCLNEQFEQLMKVNGHKFDPFCWVDFEDVFGLDELEDREIAELLFLGHMKRHLSLPFFRKLNNRYVYLTNRDGWYNKVYYRQWADFYDSLGGLLALKLGEKKLDKNIINFRRRNVYPPVKSKVLHQLNSLLTEGIVFSYPHVKQSRGQIEIPFWNIGDFYDMDEMIEEFQKKVKEQPKGYIIYDKKQKDWELSLS